MKLVPRILALGVVLPLAGLLCSVTIAGGLFRRSLVQDVDRRLLAQAAVESVSLFDGPDGRPHVHMPRSMLAAEVAAFAPGTSLIDPQGRVIMSVPAGRAVSAAPRASSAGHPRIGSPDPRHRDLTLGVMRPGDGLYTLHLVASLAPVEATMRSFYRAIGGTVAGITLLLASILYAQARRLVRRVNDLIAFVPLIGGSEAPPERRPEGTDELAALGGALTDAARYHHEQRLAQERFLANAAHQLRTPLAVLRTEIDLALRRPRDPSELREALEKAREETARLTLLARKLLDFEGLRSQPLDLQDVDLRSVVREVLERQAPQIAAAGLTLAEQGDRAVPCRCDPLLVSQALENLVDNSVRFAPAGGRLEVTARNDDGVCRLVVHDDGPGIPVEERAKVFEPFYRGSTPGSQTGLGLAFVADVARRHGGQAKLIPSAVGTTIGMEFPARRSAD
ncbi:MAG: HAMP domain-containing sensor histidine kinase [Deltaproteobacteria bacterium]|nr:HAMP domain-containing sensor histidine kinase [Myxococcales bacterium]MDP3214209.1 HAMP domain-containing sensor histidine kinase [Deltaproteobacteria bacterium]